MLIFNVKDKLQVRIGSCLFEHLVLCCTTSQVFKNKTYPGRLFNYLT